MSQALKIMTWNVQQLRVPFEIGDPEDRANRACDLILGLPPRDQPDIITFNEIFHSKARKVFVNRLQSTYSHFHKMIGKSSVPLRWDSGLAVFSKRPFHTLANGKTLYFKRYTLAFDEDIGANKGIALVRVNGPRGKTVIAFTHMQAGNFPIIRKSQFGQINKALRLNANTTPLRANTVLAGDLNVHGQITTPGSEWEQVFSDNPNTFGNLCLDGWPLLATPPGDSQYHDPGYTQKNEDGQLRRLDYVCPPRAPAGLAAHHTWIAIRPTDDTADHWAVMTVLHKPAPHCMPSIGFDIQSQAPASTAPNGKRLWTALATITEAGMYWWVFVATPGSYAVFAKADLGAAVYARNNLTKEMTDSGTVTAAQLPTAFATALTPFSNGKKYTATTPFFIRLRGTSEAFTGQAPIALVEL